MKRRPVIRLILCLITFGFAFYTTHVPPSNLPRIGRFDKLLHFAGFVYLGMMALWQVLPAGQMMSRRRIWPILALVIAYATLDEVTQPLVQRDCEITDWLADVLGAVVGVFLLFALHRLENRKIHAAGKQS